MTWHLKDRELEKKLIAIDPEFIDKLQMTKGYGNYGFYLNLGGYVYSGDCGVPKIQIYLVPEDLEEVPEYNPHAWNEYPKVIPPKNVVMRCEIYTERYDTYTPEPKGGELVDRTSGVWNGHSWDFNPLNYIVHDNWTIRYRPWED